MFNAVIGTAFLSAITMIVLERESILMLRAGLIEWVRPNAPLTDAQRLQQELAVLTQENDRLRDLLKLHESGEQNHWSITPARVVGVNSAPTFPFMILDRGASDGVRTGMPVVVNGDILIGTIASTTSRTSSMLPLTHPRSRIAASVQNSRRTIGVVQGNANLAMELLFVPRNEILQKGERVLTSGAQPLIPRELLIGEVNAVASDPGDLFLEAAVNPLYDHQRASTVGIIVNSQS